MAEVPLTLPLVALRGMASFEGQLESLDVGLLSVIQSSTTPEDKRSLLALHLASRRWYHEFSWLEIGSHLGGSLQALVRDPACTRIDSIDLRTEEPSDERLGSIPYQDNTTAGMLESLQQLPGADTSKVRTHDASTKELDPIAFEPPHVCFIDGEHTDEVCARDAEFCRHVLRDSGLVAFHDVWIIYRAVATFVEGLLAARVPHRLAYLPDSIFAIELGVSALLDDRTVATRRLQAATGVLWMLDRNDHYRAVLKGRRARVLRRLGLLRADEPIR